MEKKRNLWVIPTDKPSRLFYLASNLHIEKGQLIAPKNYKNIYITSDEEIKAKDYIFIIREKLLIGNIKDIVLIDSTKEGRTDYTRMNGTKGWFACEVNYQKDWNYKKIILTTDPDLITEGVQAIDDDFLEWFVKNPSCEFVKVEPSEFLADKVIYEIIIPKEEPKQETIVNEKCFKCGNSQYKSGKPFCTDDFCNKDFYEKPKQETGKEFYESADKIITVKKQETVELEEAAKKYSSISFNKQDLYDGFIEGAKWQAERMYSEEDMAEAFIACWKANVPDGIECKVSFNVWFEQFKKN